VTNITDEVTSGSSGKCSLEMSVHFSKRYVTHNAFQINRLW